MNIRDGIDLALMAGKLTKGMDCYTLEVFDSCIDFIDLDGQVSGIVLWKGAGSTPIDSLEKAIEAARAGT